MRFQFRMSWLLLFEAPQSTVAHVAPSYAALSCASSRKRPNLIGCRALPENVVFAVAQIIDLVAQITPERSLHNLDVLRLSCWIFVRHVRIPVLIGAWLDNLRPLKRNRATRNFFITKSHCVVQGHVLSMSGAVSQKCRLKRSLRAQFRLASDHERTNEANPSSARWRNLDSWSQ